MSRHWQSNKSSTTNTLTDGHLETNCPGYDHFGKFKKRQYQAMASESVTPKLTRYFILLGLIFRLWC